MNGPLSGLRVVELTSYVAAPLCGLVLRQLGADVVRVEPIGGAPDRSRMPRGRQGASLYWAGLNGGKRDLAVDLRRAEGRELVADLICAAGPEADPGGGVVISNNTRYEDLGFENLQARRSDLVHVLLTGTRDGRNAVDYLVQASTGFPTITGPGSGGTPVNSVVPAWDIAAGLYLAVGLLAAVHERRETRRGQQVEVALEDVAFAAAGAVGYLAEAQLYGIGRGPSGNEVYGTYGRDFVSSDGTRFMLVVLTLGHWRRLLEATELTDAIKAVEKAVQANLDDETQRYRYRAVISGLLETWFERRTWNEIDRILAPTGVLMSAYRTFNDLAADDAAVLRQNPLFQEIEQPGAGHYLAPGSPLVMGGRQFGPAPAPVVGADTDEVLTGLGIDPDRIARLRADGCVA
ncbi:CoA transferase [Acrocarpospora pleiomorpha]